MRLKDLNENFIKNFADTTIFARGLDYYKNDNVTSLEYSEEDEKISADVAGNYDDYQVEISYENDDIDADCDCPYEGYPCKHIVAVLLEFVKNRNKYVSENKTKNTEKASVIEKLNSSSKEQLINIITDGMKKYPDFKRDIQLRFMSDDTQTVKSIKKQIESAFSGNKRNIRYDDKSLSKKFEAFIKAVENSTDVIKLDIYWSVAETIIEELEEFGIYDVPIEDTAIDAIEKMIILFKKDKNKFNQERKKTIDSLIKHSFSDCSISDNLYHYAGELCLEKEDYLIMIENVKTKVSKSSSSYYKDLLAELYEKIQDELSQLQILESNLKYGMDYWELAKYWLKKNDTNKALSVVLEGIKLGEGRKTELYEYMENYYLKEKNYNMLWSLLEEKISKERFSNSQDFANDSTYKILNEYYLNPKSYNNLKKIFDLRLKAIVPDFKLYKDAKEFFTSDDFKSFEEKVIKKLNDNNKNYPLMRFTSSDETLAKIYSEKKDYVSLFKIAKKDIQLLHKYETELITIYPDEFLKEYTKVVSNLISYKGRENYQKAIPFIKGLKKIYSTVLKNNDKWREYIYNLKESNSKLKALQEELKKAGL